MSEIKIPKKLIEVALPLDIINDACAYEKMPGIGSHPRGLHLWWARRPLAAARSVIFAQLVNDPGYERNLARGLNKEKAAIERKRLFDLIGKLVDWGNLNNESVLQEAREEIKKSWKETCELNKNHPQSKTLFNPEVLPAFLDPFAGGGAIPLEAQRLGLLTNASDLNPVAVLINKVMIEFLPRFIDIKSISKIDNGQSFALDYSPLPYEGFINDYLFYSSVVLNTVKAKLKTTYPKIKIDSTLIEKNPDLQIYAGEELSIVSWLWCRTIKSSNPAFSTIDIPLVSSFVLSNSKNNECYIQPMIDGDHYEFQVKKGKAPDSLKNGTKLSRGANFKCILSESPISADYIRQEFVNKRTGVKLLAIVAEGKKRKSVSFSNKRTRTSGILSSSSMVSRSRNESKVQRPYKWKRIWI